MLYSSTDCCDGPFFTDIVQNPGLTRVSVKKIQCALRDKGL